MVKRTSLLAVPIALTIALLAALVVEVTPVAAQSEGVIGGIVYIDKNGNGIREEGEEGLAFVDITFSSGGWSTTISTTENGAFSIDLNPATWTVTVIPPEGYLVADPNREVIIEQAGDAVTNLEFALVPEDVGILPESGGIVSSNVIIGGLLSMLALGVVLVVIGQRRSKRSLP